MIPNNKIVSSGSIQLDTLVGGGIIIGDNVVWYDDAGSLASVFCLNLLKISMEQKKALIYVNFDHSPKSILEKLGSLANYNLLTILDCFTSGKAHLNKITPVAIDLSLKRGKSSLTVLKADKRGLDLLDKSVDYWNKGHNITFETEKRTTSRLEIGARLKELRTRIGLSQTHLAKLIWIKVK